MPALLRIGTRMSEPPRVAGASELALLVWTSPGFPVGAFAYSHGLEAAVEAGDITNAETLREWLRDLLRHGSGRNDAILLAAAWRAVTAGDYGAAQRVNELALAMAPSRERHLECVAQGNAFVAILQAAWPCEAMRVFADMAGDVAYCVGLGVAAAGRGMGLSAVLRAHALAFVANLVSACVRLGPIGQTDGQRVIAALLPEIAHVAAIAEVAGLDEIGGAALRSDIHSMRHETQYSRLFRS